MRAGRRRCCPPRSRTVAMATSVTAIAESRRARTICHLDMCSRMPRSDSEKARPWRTSGDGTGMDMLPLEPADTARPVAMVTARPFLLSGIAETAAAAGPPRCLRDCTHVERPPAPLSSPRTGNPHPTSRLVLPLRVRAVTKNKCPVTGRSNPRTMGDMLPKILSLPRDGGARSSTAGGAVLGSGGPGCDGGARADAGAFPHPVPAGGLPALQGVWRSLPHLHSRALPPPAARRPCDCCRRVRTPPPPARALARHHCLCVTRGARRCTPAGADRRLGDVSGGPGKAVRPLLC